ncbi:MAG TPA: LPS export ABC transporter periplasmic protein LptC [Xanthobacteraceae bacterium]|jgi:lipopolysaccharide export system protein LptC|nr:LPS export ABC transporter periplasmic protein LptC [Xanthobacteraceae bacterium]
MTSATYGDDSLRNRALLGDQRGHRARRFRAAARHSRFVRLMRYGVPLAIVLAVAGYYLSGYLNPLRLITSLPVSVGDVVVSGTKIKMEAPKLAGFTRDSRAYNFTAVEATQDVARPGIVEMKGLKAKMEMQDKTVIELSSATGVFDTTTQVLTLDDDIVVTSTSGYVGHLKHAVVETQAGNITSDQPVEMTMNDGTVRSDTFDVVKSGEVIRFNGNVVVNLKSVPKTAAAENATDPKRSSSADQAKSDQRTP